MMSLLGRIDIEWTHSPIAARSFGVEFGVGADSQKRPDFWPTVKKKRLHTITNLPRLLTQLQTPAVLRSRRLEFTVN
jgi:hypothetical protein